MMTASPTCKICDSPSRSFGNTLVLQRYTVEYYQCTQCGFIQTENPYWLAEAYDSAITNSDVGLVQRNIEMAPTVSLIIKSLFAAKRSFIDYGGGYGLFVRLMRDRGLDFFWHDPYCENFFAKHFDADLSRKQHYELLTAFEVMEHLVEPWTTLNSMQALSENILFTTFLVPDPAPPLDAWWYYGAEHGQHISLYTLESLRHLSQKLGLNLYTNNVNIHLLTSKHLNPLVFRLAASYRVRRLWEVFERKSSLLDADYQHAKNSIPRKD
jgi:hypothetical protein